MNFLRRWFLVNKNFLNQNFVHSSDTHDHLFHRMHIKHLYWHLKKTPKDGATSFHQDLSIGQSFGYISLNLNIMKEYQSQSLTSKANSKEFKNLYFSKIGFKKILKTSPRPRANKDQQDYQGYQSYRGF